MLASQLPHTNFTLTFHTMTLNTSILFYLEDQVLQINITGSFQGINYIFPANEHVFHINFSPKMISICTWTLQLSFTPPCGFSL